MALPTGAAVVTTQEPQGWSAQVQATEIAWTGPAIEDGAPGSFEAVVTHEAPEREIVRFPVVQQCGSEELAWIDSDSSAPNPAPAIAWAVVGEEGMVETAASQPHSHSNTSTIVLVVGGAIALAILAGVIYVVVRRRSQSPGPA